MLFRSLHLDLPLSVWVSDGLLAVFFFVVGVELKHELVAGSLRGPREAAVPVLAAVGGMIMPAVLFTVVVLAFEDNQALHGWAIPTATDIAFALAVLAIFGRGLPRALRLFLLTLAVVDDLLAIVVIAVFYTGTISVGALAGSFLFVAMFRGAVRMRRLRWWLMTPLAVAAWGLMHASGVHATIAGVLLGFTVPGLVVHAEREPRTHRFDQAVRPFSSTIALPVFAFSAAVLEQERRDARAAGMDGFVAKPIDAQELLRVLMPLRPPAPGSAASAAPRPAGAAEPQADANAS